MHPPLLSSVLDGRENIAGTSLPVIIRMNDDGPPAQEQSQRPLRPRGVAELLDRGYAFDRAGALDRGRSFDRRLTLDRAGPADRRLTLDRAAARDRVAGDRSVAGRTRRLLGFHRRAGFQAAVTPAVIAAGRLLGGAAHGHLRRLVRPLDGGVALDCGV